uniref:Uncharacterized protein n=1 Tax=Arundo donax TaxID=35708 RepID=A0A0A9AIV0_ARUDO
MATDARMLENLTAAGPTAGRHFEYRPEPGAPPGGVLGWSQGHPPAAWTALYLEQIYYV